MQDNPNYFSIITYDVLYDKRLKPNAKLLYCTITSLTKMNGFCWATNEYFAGLYDVSTETISRWVSQLQKYGYVTVILDQNQQYQKRKISIDKNVKAALTKKSSGIDKKVKPYIMKNNIKNNIPTAYNFLQENYPSRLEQDFLMKHKSEFENERRFNDFIEDFNDEVTSQKKEYDSALFGMLNKYARNWLRYRKDKNGSTAASIGHVITLKKIG